MKKIIILLVLLNIFGLFLNLEVQAQIGRRFPSEKKVVSDPVTGTPLTFLTSTPNGDSKIYQTHNQWTSDGKWIIFRSDRVKNEAMAVGEPMINHKKEGDYIRNIWQEHTCHLVNDEFIELLLQVKQTIQSREYLEMMKELCAGFKERSDTSTPILKPYLQHLCSAMDAWNTSLSQSN